MKINSLLFLKKWNSFTVSCFIPTLYIDIRLKENSCIKLSWIISERVSHFYECGTNHEKRCTFFSRYFLNFSSKGSKWYKEITFKTSICSRSFRYDLKTVKSTLKELISSEATISATKKIRFSVQHAKSFANICKNILACLGCFGNEKNPDYSICKSGIDESFLQRKSAVFGLHSYGYYGNRKLLYPMPVLFILQRQWTH